MKKLTPTAKKKTPVAKYVALATTMLEVRVTGTHTVRMLTQIERLNRQFHDELVKVNKWYLILEKPGCRVQIRRRPVFIGALRPG